eukprot:10277230-Alexandrium_andersonii.AAC.1
MCTEAVGMHFLCDALRSMGHTGIKNPRSMLWCDSAAGPREVFGSLPPALQPLHGFRALGDLLPPGVRE